MELKINICGIKSLIINMKYLIFIMCFSWITYLNAQQKNYNIHSVFKQSIEQYNRFKNNNKIDSAMFFIIGSERFVANSNSFNVSIGSFLCKTDAKKYINNDSCTFYKIGKSIVIFYNCDNSKSEIVEKNRKLSKSEIQSFYLNLPDCKTDKYNVAHDLKFDGNIVTATRVIHSYISFMFVPK